MVCSNLLFLYKIVYIWIFVSISQDRNIRYNFQGSRSRAKVISFQPVLPFSETFIIIIISRRVSNEHALPSFKTTQQFRSFSSTLLILRIHKIRQIKRTDCTHPVAFYIDWTYSSVNPFSLLKWSFSSLMIWITNIPEFSG